MKLFIHIFLIVAQTNNFLKQVAQTKINSIYLNLIRNDFIIFGALHVNHEDRPLMIGMRPCIND